MTGEQQVRTWACPDCQWTHAERPTYGWSAHDDRAVDVHRTALCPWRKSEPCRLGYEEHDGARYCFEHGGFLEAGTPSRRCDRAQGYSPGQVGSVADLHPGPVIPPNTWRARHVESGATVACRDRDEAEAHVRESASGPWVAEPITSASEGDGHPHDKPKEDGNA